MSQNKEFERSIRVTEFQEDLDILLSEEDGQYVQYCLKEFTKYKDVPVLVKSLLSCLKTPETRDLLPVIRELLPKREKKEYDKLAPYHKMAHPFQLLKSKKEAAKHLQIVHLEKDGRHPLGFSIRGGKEMGLGIYVSEVDIQSSADTAGLRVGDQIIEVNGINFEWLSHESAVEVFKHYSALRMVTFNSGRLPKFEESGEAFRWIDAHGNRLDDDQVKQEEEMGNQPFSSGSDKKKVVIKKQPERSVGLRIRGGKEFKLGIFVVSVDKGSLAEEQGVAVGDQILMVNGVNFKNILHEEAAAILKSNDVLMMSIQCVGRIPRLKTVYRKKQPSTEKPLPAPPTQPSDDKRNGLTPQRSNFKDGLTESPKFARRNGKDGEGTVSPLATMERNKKDKRVSNGVKEDVDGNSSDNISIDQDDENNGSSKFQYGIGKGMMLSSSAINPVREQIMSKANSLLEEEDVSELEQNLADYEENSNVNALVNFLITLLDTPKKLDLLNDIRSALKPQDLSKFDKKMSAHEVKAKQKSKRKDDDDDREPSPVRLRSSRQPTNKHDELSEEEEEEEELKPVSIKPTKDTKKGRSSSYDDDEDDEPGPVSIKPTKEIKKPQRGGGGRGRINEPIEEEEIEELTPVSIKPQKEAMEESDIEEPEPVSITPAKKPSRPSIEEDDGPSPQRKRLSPKEFEVKRQGVVVKASQMIKSMAELKSVDRRLKEYGTNQDIDFLVQFLMTILDTPKKRTLIVDIRELISPEHWSVFDNKIVQFTSGAAAAGQQPNKATQQKQPPQQKPPQQKPAQQKPAQPQSSSKQQQQQKPASAKPQAVTVEAEPGKTSGDTVGAGKPKNTEAIRQQVLAHASKVLKIKDELKGVEKRLKQYEGDSGDIDFLVTFLLTIFDSPKKHPVLGDIRDLIKEKDLSKYDEATAKFLKKPEPAAPTDKKPPTKEEVPKPINIPPPPSKPPPGSEGNGSKTTPNPASIADEIKRKGGAGSLRKTEVKEKNGEEGGVVLDPAAQELLKKAKNPAEEVPQSRESFVAWNDDYKGKSKTIASPGKPVNLEIQKSAFFLGIELMQSETDGSLLIDDITEDGAASNDGFLTAGFKILKVDDTDLNCMTVGDAEAVLNEKYDSDKPTINLLVVAPPAQ